MGPLFFSVVAAAATLLGGSIPLLKKRLSETTLTLLVAFSAGVLLSTGLNHMVAESFSQAGKWAMLAVSIGFLALYGYEKVSMVHACREQDCELHNFGPAALVGIGFHSLLDGYAIAVSFELETTLGLIVLAAVVLHRLPTGISIACLLLANHYETGKAWRILTGIAGLAVIGALAGTLLGSNDPFYLSMAVGLSAGTFLYISTSDLLPMAHQNAQDYRVPLLFLVGFISVLASSFLPH